MGAVLVLAPVVIAAWPAFSAAVVAAAGSLGYQVASGVARYAQVPVPVQKEQVNLEIPRSEVVTGQLGRDQRIIVEREGITVVFARDERGKATLQVLGQGHAEEELRALGEQLGQAVIQQYVHQKLMDEMRARGFVVVEEEVREDRAIHLKVRHWEG